MTIYEFYVAYVLTGKAIIVSTNLQPLRSYLYDSTIRIEYRTSANSRSFEIPHNSSIDSLRGYGLKIALITNPVYISASVLTGVISMPVPEHDDLPF